MREEGRAVWRTETTERLCVLGVRDKVSFEFLFFFSFLVPFFLLCEMGRGKGEKDGKGIERTVRQRQMNRLLWNLLVRRYMLLQEPRS